MTFTLIQGDNRQVLKTLADNSVDAIITDPPYGISFLGKDWDSFRNSKITNNSTIKNLGSGMRMTTHEENLNFQLWCEEWSRECFRVLKPGGYMLSFCAARMYHRMTVGLEDAGFEIRDQIMWIYSSGFPKSQDVGKSIDRQSGKAAHKADLAEVKAILKQLYKDSGKSNTQIDRECGFNAGGYLKTDFKDKGWANNLPKDDKWLTLKSVLGCGDDYDDFFITTPQVKIGEKETGCFGEGSDYTIGGRSQTVDITKSQTDAGKQWSGWGTALKPAHEPIALARKPTKLSTAKNVQQWGTGALNIDACRIGDDPMIIRHLKKDNGAAFTHHGDGKKNWDTYEDVGTVEGRFPSNVIGELPDYQKYFYCPKVSRRERHMGFDPNSQGVIIDSEVFGKTPVCLDCGKTRNGSTKHDKCDPNNITFEERRTKRSEEIGNNHPTVKPVALMEYLIKLITPPGGTVLDPFNGSGSTGMAAVGLGFNYIGIDLDSNYIDISRKRIEAWLKRDEPKVNPQFEKLFEDDD